MTVITKDGKTKQETPKGSTPGHRTIAGKLPNMNATQGQRLKDQNLYPIVLVNVLHYEKIILSLIEKDVSLVDAKQLNEAIVKDPTLADNTINWTQWNSFLNQKHISPEKDKFNVLRLILCGILLCEGSPAERALVLWRLVTNQNQFAKKPVNWHELSEPEKKKEEEKPQSWHGLPETAKKET